MEYELKHGDKANSLISQMRKNGDDVPDFIKNRPVLKNQSLQFYLQAFFALETERHVGFAVLPIPITKIIEYGYFLGYNSSDINNFIEIIRALDITALKFYNKDKKGAKS